MKALRIYIPPLAMLLYALTLLACNPRMRHEKVAVFTDAHALMRGDTSHTGFFTNAFLLDSAYTEAEIRTTHGGVFIPNDGTQNVLLCRYDPGSDKPIWIAYGSGPGADGGVNYYAVPKENAVYVTGYFESKADFAVIAGERKSLRIESRGYADMFVAKFTYDSGKLEWLNSGGSAYSDIIFRDTEGHLHSETLMMVDSAAVTVYANFFGQSQFGTIAVDAKESGSAVMVRYDKNSGEVLSAQIATSLPAEAHR